jgi:hypothetical protein
MDLQIPHPDTYAPTAAPPASAAAAANLLHDQAGRQQANIGMHRQDGFCDESRSQHINTLWRQGLQWLADSQENAQKILVEYEAGHHAVQPRAPNAQHVQDLNGAPLHHEPPLPSLHSSPTVAQVPICHAPSEAFSHTPMVAKGTQHWDKDFSYAEGQTLSTHPQQGHMLSSAQTWSAPAAAAHKPWEEAASADLISETQPNCNGLQAQKHSNSTSWQAGDPVCNRGDSTTNSYGQNSSDLHTRIDLAAAQPLVAYAQSPLHLPGSTNSDVDNVVDNVVDDDNDFDLQRALAMSLAQFEMEDMLRTTAESLPVKRQNGGGHVWQSKHSCCNLCYSGMSEPAISRLSASAFRFEFSRLVVMTFCMTAQAAAHCWLLCLCWACNLFDQCTVGMPRAFVDISSDQSANFL